MADDEELAEYLLDQPPPAEQAPVRRLSEYSTQVELLTAIFDRLAETPQAIAAANGAKPRKVKPYPRPVTAIERVRERRAQRKHRAVVARVLPGGGDTEAFLRDSEPKKRRRRGRSSGEQPRQLFPGESRGWTDPLSGRDETGGG